MNILIAINQSRVLYDFKRELVSALLARGDRVRLSYEEDFRAEYFARSGAEIVPTPIDPRGVAPSKDLRLYLFYRRLLKRLNPDLALTFTIKPNVYCARACRALGVPYLATISGFGAAANAGGLLQRLTTTLYRIGLSGASRVFCQNESIANKVVAMKMTRPDRVVRVSGSGVDLDRFPTPTYPSSDAPIKLLFVGRLMRDKGVDELLEVARRVRARRPDVVFQLLGARERGCDDVFERVEAAARSGDVEYLGYKLDVRPTLAESSAVLLPSYHEGLSNALLEGAAAGRPLLASDISGCRETFDEGATGIGFAPRDVDSLEAAVERFLAKPWAERRAMGERGRAKVAREFSRADVVATYLREIDAVAAAGRPGK